MTGGALQPTLLFLALGLALTFSPRTAWPACVLALLASVTVFALLLIPKHWLEGISLCTWTSVVATAGTVYFAPGIHFRAALGLSINAGLWAGAGAAVAGSTRDLMTALPAMLIAVPASAVAARYSSLPIKVASSWIIAVALLAATLHLLPVTPGYLPDHLD